LGCAKFNKIRELSPEMTALKKVAIGSWEWPASSRDCLTGCRHHQLTEIANMFLLNIRDIRAVDPRETRELLKSRDADQCKVSMPETGIELTPIDFFRRREDH
jgi:hypothetical protein